jgi:hypothetical protein
MRRWRRRTRRLAAPPPELTGGRWPDRSGARISIRTRAKQSGGKGGSLLRPSWARGDGRMGWWWWHSSSPWVNQWGCSSEVLQLLQSVKQDLRPPVVLAAQRCSGVQAQVWRWQWGERWSGWRSMGPFIGASIPVSPKQPSKAYPQGNQRSIWQSVRIFANRFRWGQFS